ncbi:hypothetical protein RI367_001396 [Sorochytrium milnesiophthora]
MTRISKDPRKKLVIVGDGAVGKTALLMTYAQNKFPEEYVPTVFENYTVTPTIPKTSKKIELALWDTAGQEDYDRLRPLSYPDTDIILIAFRVAQESKASFDNVWTKWCPEIKHFCERVPRILVGTMCDLRETAPPEHVVTESEIEQMTKRIRAECYIECSARKRHNIQELFDTAVSIAMRGQKKRGRRGCPIM